MDGDDRGFLHLAKDCVFSVEVFALVKRDEKLRPVVVGPSIGKCHLATRAELEPLVKLVLEGSAVARLTALQPSWRRQEVSERALPQKEKKKQLIPVMRIC